MIAARQKLGSRRSANRTHIEILEGLNLGEIIVITGQGSLKDSARVEVINGADTTDMANVN